MKRYNVNTSKIENLSTTIVVGGINKYVTKMTETELIAVGYLPIRYETKPDRRYYTSIESGVVIGDEYVVTYTATERPLTEVQDMMLRDLTRTADEKMSGRPRIHIPSLGFDVDGGMSDLTFMNIGRKRGYPVIRDADNVDHTASTADYDTVIDAIETYGMGILETKWTKEAEIKALATVSDCALYEATPYQVDEPVLDPLTGIPTGVTRTVTKYKNNVKEW